MKTTNQGPFFSCSTGWKNLILPEKDPIQEAHFAALFCASWNFSLKKRGIFSPNIGKGHSKLFFQKKNKYIKRQPTAVTKQLFNTWILLINSHGDARHNMLRLQFEEGLPFVIHESCFFVDPGFTSKID